MSRVEAARPLASQPITASTLGRFVKKPTAWAFRSERHGALMRRVFARPFRKGSRPKLLVLFESRRIALSQVYPFAAFRRQLEHLYGCEIRLAPNSLLDHGMPAGLRGADTVVFQNWLTDPPDRLPRMLDQIEALFDAPRVIFFDPSANVDARFFATLDGRVVHYARKSLLKDPAVLAQSNLGDTPLTHAHHLIFNLDGKPVQHIVPPNFLDRLVLTPNFHTAPQFLHDLLLPGVQPPQGPRTIDIQARFAVDGTPWYAAMRRQARNSLTAIAGIDARIDEGLDWAAYMNELRHAQLCLSPFGYGEICWRDIEAIIAGAVLVKPDMSHLRTLPDIYVPDETYVPVAWDYRDLEDVVRGLLADPGRCRRIAQNAFDVLRRHVTSGQILTDYAFVFRDAGSQRSREPIILDPPQEGSLWQI